MASQKRSFLDTRIQIVLPSSDLDNSTASRRDGVSFVTERLHRLHGTSLIRSAARLLFSSSNHNLRGRTGINISTSTCNSKLHKEDELHSSSCYATACSIFHRFYYAPQSSLKTVNVWSAAMASLILAAKIEEIPLTIRHVLVVFSHLYRRRCLLIIKEVDQDIDKGKDDNGSTSEAGCMAVMIRTRLHRHAAIAVAKGTLPKTAPLNENGPVWKEWYDSLIETESLILRHLGFTLYWIPEEHPHKFLVYMWRALEENYSRNDNQDCKDPTNTLNKSSNSIARAETPLLRLRQQAWEYCNDASRLDLCVRTPPEVIACAALLLASLDLQHEILIGGVPASQTTTTATTSTEASSKGTPQLPQPWWHVFCGTSKDQELSYCCNAILSLQQACNFCDDSSSNEDSTSQISAVDLKVANVGFVRSLEPGGSFNDPGSFLWDFYGYDS